MADVGCPYCAAPTDAYLAAPDYNRRVSEVVFHLRRCTGCGLLFVADPPDDLGRYYASDYHYVPEDRAAILPHLDTQRFKLEIVQRFCPSNSLLEIGPSIGIFCALAKDEGFAVHAIEMDAGCVRFLKEQLRIETTQSADPASVLRENSRRYDAICLWHALEHIPRFWETLEAAVSRLNPSGALVIAVPNPLSWQARLMGARWPHHDLPRHLFGIPMTWMQRWAAERGLDVALATTRDEGSLYWNRFSWGMLALKLRAGAKPGGRLWRLGLRFGALMSRWEDREGQGACYTMVLRRPAS